MKQTVVPHIEHFEWFSNCQTMKVQIADVFMLNGFTVDDKALERIISSPIFRDVFIVSLYNLERERGTKAEYLYWKLGEIFGIHTNSVRNIISRHCNNNTKTSQ